MNVTRCANGHYFDADKYEVCPHCGAASILPKDEPKKEYKGLFDKKKKEEQENVVIVPEETIGKTLGLFPKKEAHGGITADTVDEVVPAEEPKAQPAPVADIPASNPALTYEDASEGLGRQQESLQSEIKKVSSSKEGKTVGFFSTISAEAETEPVVGWLVCIGGKHFGESFNLAAGRNSVGRGSDNKVVLSKDEKVSRSKQIWITYEPKKRQFFVSPGDSSALAYHNDDTIMESKRLNANDLLELGDGKYMFVPLCSDTFSWDEL